jgi:hypothetical protein
MRAMSAKPNTSRNSASTKPMVLVVEGVGLANSSVNSAWPMRK